MYKYEEFRKKYDPGFNKKAGPGGIDLYNMQGTGNDFGSTVNNNTQNLKQQAQPDDDDDLYD